MKTLTKHEKQLLKCIKLALKESQDWEEPFDEVDWYKEIGVLLSIEEVLFLLSFLKK